MSLLEDLLEPFKNAERMGFKCADELSNQEIKETLLELAPIYEELEGCYQEAVGLWGLFNKKKTGGSAKGSASSAWRPEKDE